jgi:hypothetical protein
MAYVPCWCGKGEVCLAIRNKTIQKNWISGRFIGIMVVKHLRENPFASGTNHFLKVVAYVLRRRRIRTDDQVILWSVLLVGRLSAARRNPQNRKAQNWVTSLT